jgi:hypothetical protein
MWFQFDHLKQFQPMPPSRRKTMKSTKKLLNVSGEDVCRKFGDHRGCGGAFDTDTREKMTRLFE